MFIGRERDNNSQSVNDMNDLFNYIDPEGNDMFSLMKGIDLQDLLYYIENYYLELRDNLGLGRKITFGLELEFEDADVSLIINKLREDSSFNDWKIKNDTTLYRGAEINSPILRDTNNSWNNLQKVCSIIDGHAVIGSSSGGHIHVGTKVIGEKRESWLNFIKLWSVYENIIYRFSYGDFLTSRSSIVKYASPMTKVFWRDYQRLSRYGRLNTFEVIREISHKRNQAVNFNNVSDLKKTANKNTIEFRCPNGTIDPVIWQNNVNLFVNMLLYSKSTRYNDDIIQNRKNINGDKYSELCWYGEIYLQQALELCDMLFTNNLDKIYFLRQYLKSFETIDFENTDLKLSKTKSFTKKLRIRKY